MLDQLELVSVTLNPNGKKTNKMLKKIYSKF